jgi:hypothetical protein
MQNRKPFNLERALAGDPVVRGDGLKVIELKCFDKPNRNGRQVIALFEDGTFGTFLVNGKKHERESGLDLLMAPKTTNYNIDIYQNDSGFPYIRNFYKSTEIPVCDINGHVTDTADKFLKTISFEIGEEPKKEKKTLWIGVERKTLGDGPHFVTDAHQSKDELIKEYPCSIEDMEIKAIEVEV